MNDANELRQAGVLARHQAALRDGKFLIQRCTNCLQPIYFPREGCPHCGSDALDLIQASGLGTVYAMTTVRRKPADGGDYNVSLIELDEGVRLMSRVDNLQPDEVSIGLRVRARVQRSAEHGLVVFDALTGGAAT